MPASPKKKKKKRTAGGGDYVRVYDGPAAAAPAATARPSTGGGPGGGPAPLAPLLPRIAVAPPPPPPPRIATTIPILEHRAVVASEVQRVSSAASLLRAELETTVRGLRAELREAEMRSELEAELRAEMEGEMEGLRGQVTKLTEELEGYRRLRATEGGRKLLEAAGSRSAASAAAAATGGDGGTADKAAAAAADAVGSSVPSLPPFPDGAREEEAAARCREKSARSKRTRQQGGEDEKEEGEEATTTPGQPKKKKKRINKRLKGTPIFGRVPKEGGGYKHPPKLVARHDALWAKWYDRLKQFHSVHGHCNVPKRYGVDDASDPELRGKNGRLYGWAVDQRTEHRRLREGKPSKMTPDRIRQLRELGFVFQLSKVEVLPWDTRFQQLLEYRDRVGNCNVPQYYDDPEIPEGLGNWVLGQRKDYKQVMDGVEKRTLTRERIAMMEDAGFKWTLRNRGGGGGAGK